ncbi:MAG: hypothetical protein ABSA84_02130 [Gammaproteobacteria bacterium]|jgi:hypothetical protein
MPLLKEITKPFREVVKAVPIVGHTAAKIIRETARVADQVTKPVQEPIKGLVNDVTGARKRENTRLDAEKQRLINESKNRVMAQKANNAANIREIMATQINVLRAEIHRAEKDNIADAAGGKEERILNPIFAYEECSTGQTKELALILSAQQTEDYNFFIELNPLNEAYLSYIQSNIISIEVLRILSEHNHQSINTSKIELSANVWININDAIAGQNFEKVKRIMLAFIQIEGENAFLGKVREKTQLHQPLINAAILRNDHGIVFGELHGGTQPTQVASTSLKRPRPY